MEWYLIINLKYGLVMKKSIIAASLILSFGANAGIQTAQQEESQLRGNQSTNARGTTAISQVELHESASLEQAEFEANKIHDAALDLMKGKGQNSYDKERQEIAKKEGIAGKGQSSSLITSTDVKKEIARSGTIETNRVKSEKNSNAVDSLQTVSAYTATKTLVNDARISSNSDKIAQNTKLINKNTADIADLRVDLERQGKELSAGIAGVAAMANIPHMQEAGQFSVGAGAGYYNGESAVAVGLGYRVNNSLTTQLGVSANTGNDIKPIVGAGVAFAF